MSEITLENLARRLDEIERRLNETSTRTNSPTKNWRTVVGISEENEFTRSMLSEIETAHESERQSALAEDAP